MNNRIVFVQRGLSNACIEYIHGVPDPGRIKDSYAREWEHVKG